MIVQQNKTVKYVNLGLIDYKEAWDYQTHLFEQIVEIKIKNRKGCTQELTPNYLLFCSHPPVYTLGKSGNEKNLLINSTSLENKHIGYYKINRGGDITYHGPGQVVGYPILDLDNFITDIHLYLRNLEEAVIRTLNDYNISAGRIEGLTGVWIDAEGPNQRKISALGVKTSRWVTMHGFAFNVNVDIDFYNHIVPCGIDDKAVTSLHLELGKQLNINEVEMHLIDHLSEVFQMRIEYGE